MSKLILFKGNHKILKIEEIANKAHAITPEGTFKIKENSHSNTFLSYPLYSQISRIYELVPVDYREIYNYLAFCSITDIKWTDIPLTVEELETLRSKYFLFTSGQSICKILYSEIIRVLKYRQSLENLHEFNLYENIEESKRVKSWVLGTFTGSSFELGFFILLECLERNMLEGFIIEWKKADLFDIDLKGFLGYIDNSFLDKNEKTRIKIFLSKFI